MLKTIATCKPTEFLKQTNRIRKTAEKWLKDTDILNIRREMPELKEIPEDAADAVREAIEEENRKAIAEQAQKNLSLMLDALLEEHPEETLELLALCCFVEPENVDDNTVEEYLQALTEIVNNRTVLSFFISLIRPGRMLTSQRPKR